MSYELYMGNILFPVVPSKIDTKIKGKNKTITLINGEEINILKEDGLTEISCDLLLPNVKYPFASYEGSFKKAKYYLDVLEKIKTDKKPFQFIVIRTFPDGRLLFNTDVKVSLEEYQIKEDRKEGFDVVVSVKMKQYRHFETKKHIVKSNDAEKVSVQKNRAEGNSPLPAKTTTYTVKKGDCLWNIAKMFYGDGSKYLAIYEANKDKISGSYVIYAGQVLTIPDATTAVSTNTTSASASSTTSKRVFMRHVGYLNGFEATTTSFLKEHTVVINGISYFSSKNAKNTLLSRLNPSNVEFYPVSYAKYITDVDGRMVVIFGTGTPIYKKG